MGPIVCTINKKVNFGEKKFIEKLGECSFFTSKEPINVESHMYKVTK